MTAVWIVVGVVGLLLVVVLGLFNALVKARQRVMESWSDVDTELERRHDLIPNLVSTVKGYMKHERELLEELAKLREDAVHLRPGSPSRQQAGVEDRLGSVLAAIQARIEAYPELKASANCLALQGELANTEDRIALSLRYYNANVRELNVRCQSFPGSLIAGAFGFRSAEYFHVAGPSARAAPEVGLAT